VPASAPGADVLQNQANDSGATVALRQFSVQPPM
jgi:hypothetical protein